MKLRESRILFLAQEIVKILEAEDFMDVFNNDAAIAHVQSSIVDDLMQEELLEDEVRAILEQHADTIDQDRIQYHEMFKMVKSKLAKERNLIL